MKNKLSLLDILNEVTTPQVAPKTKKLPFDFNFSMLPKGNLDDLVNHIESTLTRNKKMRGSTSLEKIIDYTSKGTNNLKNAIDILLANNIISNKDITKILNKSNPIIVDDIEKMLTGLTNKDDIARAKVKVRDKYVSQFKALPDEVVEEFIESNRIRLLRNTRKAFTSGFTSLKGSKLSLQATANFFKSALGRNYTALTPEERKILQNWLVTGIGNWVEVSEILKKSGAPKYLYAASHMSGQLVQKYLFWVSMYTTFSFLTNFFYDYFVPGQKYSTKAEGFGDRVGAAIVKGFTTVGFAGILPISVILKFIYENSRGGDFYESDVYKWLQIIGKAKDAAYEAMYNEYSKPKKIDVPKKTLNPEVPVKKTTTTPTKGDDTSGLI